MSDSGRHAERGRDEGKRDEGFKIFVGGLSWQMKETDLKEAFSKYDPTDATIILDKHTNRPRGFGFVWFKDKLGMEDAIRDMHEKELEGRKISCVPAVPMDQTRPGTPAFALGGGAGAPRGDYGRYPQREAYGARDAYAGRGYERGYAGDRYAAYERPGAAYDRGGYAGGAAYNRDYDSRAYGAAYAGDPRYGGAAAAYSDPYARSDPYASAGYAAGYERGYDGYDRGASGPDRRSYGNSAPRPGPYDRPSERRSDVRR